MSLCPCLPSLLSGLLAAAQGLRAVTAAAGKAEKAPRRPEVSGDQLLRAAALTRPFPTSCEQAPARGLALESLGPNTVLKCQLSLNNPGAQVIPSTDPGTQGNEKTMGGGVGNKPRIELGATGVPQSARMDLGQKRGGGGLVWGQKGMLNRQVAPSSAPITRFLTCPMALAGSCMRLNYRGRMYLLERGDLRSFANWEAHSAVSSPSAGLSTSCSPRLARTRRSLGEGQSLSDSPGTGDCG